MAVVNLEHTPRNHYEVIFSNGFRPMFTLVALQALLALGGWLAFWNGWLAAPETLGTPCSGTDMRCCSVLSAPR
jgi:NnrS protein.